MSIGKMRSMMPVRSTYSDTEKNNSRSNCTCTSAETQGSDKALFRGKAISSEAKTSLSYLKIVRCFQSPWLGRLRPIGGKRMHVPDAGSTDTPEDQQQKHKQLRFSFSIDLPHPGGIYLTRKITMVTLSSRKLLRIPMLMSYKSSLSESDIDWTPTLYSLAVSERRKVPKSY
ncbi:hypothetical protein JCM33374_g6639 [Metschnikowia sp. JCM 33374]|nr:hypothetical protein JCM33374_g6639 [Metschnikowia sp. JCM 33374]